MYGIFAIDGHYIKEQLACSYLMVEGKEALFVENNTAKSVPYFLQALKKRRISTEKVKYLIITHVHLDHAGGTSALLEHCPNAVVVAHPRAAKHVINPSRLVASAQEVYGKDEFERLFGEIKPIPEERVRIVDDREEMAFGNRTLTFLYTRGHANHHMCIYDDKSKGIFTGDTFGIGYPLAQTGKKPLLYPSTSPTDFDATEAMISLDKIEATGAERAYLTHFGIWDNMPLGQEMMREGIKRHQRIFEVALGAGYEGEHLNDFLAGEVNRYFEELLKERKISLSSKAAKMIKIDIDLNAQGLAVAVTRQRSR